MGADTTLAVAVVSLLRNRHINPTSAAWGVDCGK